MNINSQSIKFIILITPTINNNFIVLSGTIRHHEAKNSIKKVAVTGGQQVLECHLQCNYTDPNLKFILYWHKASFSQPILVKYHGYSAQVS